MSLTELRWLQQIEADVPADSNWLSRAEADQAASFRIPKRRRDWRLGRWTTKRAVSNCLAMPQDASSLSKIEVRAAASGAPEVFICNLAAEISISVSHRGGIAICAVAAPGIQLGCDLELIEPHSQAFVRDYFTAEEQAIVGDCAHDHRDALVSLIWSAKESALKAMKTGLREDTRSVSVDAPEHFPGNGCWSQIRVRTPGAGLLSGWWQRSEILLRTIVAAPFAQPPIQMV